MANVFPVPRIRYNPGKVALSKLSRNLTTRSRLQMQEAYYAASPYNLVRIILGKREVLPITMERQL